MVKWIQQLLSDDFTISKRLMGIACVLGGIMGAIGIVMVDMLREGSSFGPFQKLALVATIAVAVIGLTLIPLKDRPA
ncbi:MAG: hypothetical protein HY862_02100 [Chloroflexi bacterium]|nr:hypothetical protein [Chloroflexota bacterium]